MDKRQHAIFIKRSGDIYSNHKRRAKDYCQKLTYDVTQLRSLIKESIGLPCPYCGDTIGVKTFSIDHSEPVSRSRDLELSNLVVCCLRCNQTKGVMNHAEFSALLLLIQDWATEVRRDLLARLRSGGRFRRH